MIIAIKSLVLLPLNCQMRKKVNIINVLTEATHFRIQYKIVYLKFLKQKEMKKKLITLQMIHDSVKRYLSE